MMQRIGLYYPYVHFRDEAWLKAAALYWPRMARVVPPGYPVDDPRHVSLLRDELDFVVDVDPQDSARAVAAVFLRILENRSHVEALRDAFLRYESPWGYSSGWVPSDNMTHARIGGDGPLVVSAEPQPVRPSDYTPVPDRDLTGLHWDEVDPMLRERLMVAGLARATEQSAVAPSTRRKWLAMPPMLGWVYKCMLTEEISRRTRYVPATDQDAAYYMIGNWDEATIVSTCTNGFSRPSSPAADLVGHLGTLAIAAALPSGLADVPVEKIVKLRKNYVGEFNAFTDAVATATADLEEHLAGIEDARALREYMRLLLARTVEEPLHDLRRAIRGLRLRSTSTVLNYKFEVGSLTTALASTLGQGSVTAAGVTFGLTVMRQGLAEARDAQIKGSSVGFLLRSSHLAPATFKRRALRTISRAIGIGP